MTKANRQSADGKDGSDVPLRTSIVAGVVDVLVIAPAPPGRRDRWRVLTLRRAEGVRCTGAWEMVHGSIEAGERPEEAALREVAEETGLRVERLYSITVNPFYVHSWGTIQLAVVFAAIVDASQPVQLQEEHDSAVWRTPAAAAKHFSWPRTREAMHIALDILASGDAGPREDVLRIT